MNDELIWVRPGNDRKVGVIETDERHPGGIARVVGDALDPDNVKPVQVYPTPRIHHALGRGYIQQVAESEVEEARPRRKIKATPQPQVDDTPVDEKSE